MINLGKKTVVPPGYLGNKELGDQVGSLQESQKGNKDDINKRGLNVLYPPAPLMPAKGDGTDDWQRLTDLIAYAKSNKIDKVFLPKPSTYYYISKPIELKDGIEIYGAGKIATELRTNVNTEAFKNPTGVGVKYVTLRGMTIKPTGSALSSARAIDFTDVGNSLIDDIYITNFDTGIYFSTGMTNVGYYNRVYATKIFGCRIAMHLNKSSNGFNVYGCELLQNVEGVRFSTQSGGNTFTGCSVEVYDETSVLSNPVRGFVFADSASDNVMIGCRIELKGSADALYLESGTPVNNMSIGSSLFVGSSATGASSFDGFVGLVKGENNVILSGRSPSELNNVKRISTSNKALSFLTLDLLSKTASSEVLKVNAYDSSLTNLLKILTIVGGMDIPEIRVSDKAILKTINLTYHNSIEGTKNGEGVIMRSPNGSKFKLTIGDDGVLKTTAIT